MTLPRKLLSYGMNELHEDHSFRGGSQISFSSWSIPTTSGFVWPRKVPHITPMSPHPTQTNEPSSKGSPRDKSGFVSPRNPKLLQLLGFPEKKWLASREFEKQPKSTWLPLPCLFPSCWCTSLSRSNSSWVAGHASPSQKESQMGKGFSL